MTVPAPALALLFSQPSPALSPPVPYSALARPTRSPAPPRPAPPRPAPPHPFPRPPRLTHLCWRPRR